jgi:UDP-glucose 4-epimerase
VQPTDPGWVDLAFGIPLLDTAKVRRELGWEPTRDAGAVVLEALSGVSDGAGGPSAVLRSMGSPAEQLRDAFRALLPGRSRTS